MRLLATQIYSPVGKLVVSHAIIRIGRNRECIAHLAGVLESCHHDCWGDFLNVYVRTYNCSIISTSEERISPLQPTMVEAHPYSSNVTLFSVFAQSAMIFFPVEIEPVKEIFWIRG